MGEEVDMISSYDGMEASVGDDERVLEWEIGLPNANDLTPLSQPLIPPELASAFSISPEPFKTLLDVHRASQSTVSSLRRQVFSNSSSASVKMFPSFAPAAAKAATTDHPDRDDPDPDPVVEEGDEVGGKEGGLSETESSKKLRGAGGSDEMEDFDSGSHMENDENSNSGRASKKPRLVWTPQLHKRFVDVVAHLGLKNAVPKTIMQLMNVDGLTRENVASHLQKYRLYMKRMQGIPDEGPSSPPPPPDQNGRQETAAATATTATRVPLPMPYVGAPGMIPMPVIGMRHHGHGGPVGMMPVGGQPGGGRSPYHGFESHHPYAMFGGRPREWPRGNHSGSPVPYPHPGSNDKS